MHHGVGELHDCVFKDSSALRKQMDDDLVRMFHRLGKPLAERVLEVLEDQSRDAGVVTDLYVES